MPTQPTLPLVWPQTDPREWALAQGYVFEWEDDWHIGSHVDEYPDAYDDEPRRCEVASLRTADGDVLASLGCIDDADVDYRRQIERELAYEVMPGEVSAA